MHSFSPSATDQNSTYFCTLCILNPVFLTRLQITDLLSSHLPILLLYWVLRSYLSRVLEQLPYSKSRLSILRVDWLFYMSLTLTNGLTGLPTVAHALHPGAEENAKLLLATPPGHHLPEIKIGAWP